METKLAYILFLLCPEAIFQLYFKIAQTISKFTRPMLQQRRILSKAKECDTWINLKVNVVEIDHFVII